MEQSGISKTEMTEKIHTSDSCLDTLLDPDNVSDQEVTALGNSENFMNFLAKRSQENGSISLDEIEDKLMNET